MNVTRNRLTRVEEPSSLIPILKERLPHSCVVFNQIKSFNVFKDAMEIYVYNEKKNYMPGDSDTWILTKYLRQGFADVINISIPREQELKDRSVSEDFKQALKYEIINDNKFTFLCPIKGNVWNKFMEVAMARQGLPVTCTPMNLFKLRPEQADVSAPMDAVVKHVYRTNGFNVYNKFDEYFAEGSDPDPLTKKAMEHLPSAAVYLMEGGRINEDPVSGVVMSGSGVINMYHADEGHDYRAQAMKLIAEDLVEEEFYSCLALKQEVVEEGNKCTHTDPFLESIGMMWFADHYLLSN